MTIQVPPPPSRVVLVDDDEATRMLLRIVLGTEPRFAVVGEAADGVAGWQLIHDTVPDLAVVDLHMPRLSGLEVLKRVRDSGTRTRVVLHSGDPAPPGPPDPDAFVLKDGDMDGLLAVLVRLLVSPPAPG